MGVISMSEENNEKPRIGVYVCHCGGNISDYVDVKKVVEAVKNYPGVVVAKDYMFMCSDTGQQMIIDDIKKYNLNGVVVAACSPKLHELTFRNAVSKAGLNPFRFYHINIREHSSWAHSDNREGATRKAISHVLTGIEYVKLARSLDKISVEATKSVLVIGGGVTGMRAAVDLADLGFNVVLVEKKPYLGGRVLQWNVTAPYERSGKEIAGKLIEEVKKRKNIIVITNAEVVEVEGFVGNFEVTIEREPRYVLRDDPNFDRAIEVCPVEVPNEFDFGLTKRKALYRPPEGAYPSIPVIDMKACTKCGECLKYVGDAVDLNAKPERHKVKVGAIIVATGFKPYEPKEGEFGYKKYSRVITLPQLQRLMELQAGSNKLIVDGKEIKSVAFIYCVGSRQPQGNTYCSRYCCTATIHTALALKKRIPDLKLYHFYRDIRTYGFYELHYVDAQKQHMVFMKYPDDKPPIVEADGEKLVVKAPDVVLGGKEVSVSVDLVVLVVGMVPEDGASKLANVLKVSTGIGGFFQEAHPKLRPVDTLKAGIYIAGTAQAPRLIIESIASASAAAAKTATLLIKGKIELEPSVAEVIAERCDLSGRCMEVCPSNAIKIKEYPGLGKRAWVNQALCTGCGACTAVCPNEAIQLKTLTTEQIKNMIRAAATALAGERV